MTELSGISTPFNIMHSIPMKTFLPIFMGLDLMPWVAYLLLGVSKGWKSVSIIVLFAPIKVPSPITILVAATIDPPEIPTSLPIMILAFKLQVHKIVGWLIPNGFESQLFLFSKLSPILISLLRYLNIFG